jgi:hypothetical protein
VSSGGGGKVQLCYSSTWIYSSSGDAKGLTGPGFNEGNIHSWTAFVASSGSLGTLRYSIKDIVFFFHEKKDDVL